MCGGGDGVVWILVVCLFFLWVFCFVGVLFCFVGLCLFGLFCFVCFSSP